eukprot:Opistho-2@90297
MTEGQRFFLDFKDAESDLKKLGGGKAANMWRLTSLDFCTVPDWFCVSTDAFMHFIEYNNLQGKLVVKAGADLAAYVEDVKAAFMTKPLPPDLEEGLRARLSQRPFSDHHVAVRSSGTDEDSGDHSFAGQFETYLFQKGPEQVIESLRLCWISCYSERVMQHRIDCGLPTSGSKMAVVVQMMVNSAASGVAFSRHPLKAVSVGCVFVEAVYGLGEGLVSGEIEPDSFEIMRNDWKVTKELVDKPHAMLRAPDGGLIKADVAVEKQKVPAISDEHAVQIAKLMVQLEERMGRPQDFEWGIEDDGKLYCLQARPIVTLPPNPFFDNKVLGDFTILWDNSNIVESYSGVTTPLTFSFASLAYELVYTCALSVGGVPPEIIKEYKPYLSNMLGLVRGNIYYNLMNWYRALSCVPIGGDKSKFMETMLGVKQELDPSLERQLGTIAESAPKYSIARKIRVIWSVLYNVYYIDNLVANFFKNFNAHYEKARRTNYDALPLDKQIGVIRDLFENIIHKWETPIINDTYVMLFFGQLKKMVSKIFKDDKDPNKAQSLQNDLLCGQGDVESTEPTKMMMRIAEKIDSGAASTRTWFINKQDEVVAAVHAFVSGNAAKLNLDASQTAIISMVAEFLDRFGFRCINELKLEESTLHDDPGFVIDSIAGYVKTKSYSIKDMEEREKKIKEKAEEELNSKLNVAQKVVFQWVLFHARRGVRHRENMRFARTKLWGIFRDLFRAIGNNLVRMNQLENRQDVFFL